MTHPFKFDGQRPFLGQLCLTLPPQWKHLIFAPTSGGNLSEDDEKQYKSLH